MLKLDRLDISGFKSFVDPVTAQFAEGITAIVGPNGCGKSNLSEAITWVLGEQSAKTLRGGRMEDVIFSGTDKRKPLGMAEVSLTFVTDGSYAAADENGRITIGRRVFRSGEGQYRLNDKIVRLRDVKDLLMDTGLGVRAYAVIEQGRIGMILSGKPQDRRKLIEEAAGITRYKQRKRIAELKLEEANANLLRLDDIVSEVERALRTLKRQANAATRFTERESEYKELLETLLVGQWARQDLDLKSLEKELGSATEIDSERAAQVAQDGATLATSRERLEEFTHELSARHQKQADLAATIQGRQEFIKATRQTLVELRERHSGGLALASQRKSELTAVEQTLGLLTSKGAKLLNERERAQAAVIEDRQRLLAAAERVKSTETLVEGLRTEMMSSMNRVTSIQNRLHQEQIESEKGNYRNDHLKNELTSMKAEFDKVNEETEAANQRVSDLQEKLAKEVQDRTERQQQLDRILEQEAEGMHRRQETQHRLANLSNRRTVLEELERAELERREKIREALASNGFGHLRFLDQEVDVPTGWEGSIDLYLSQLRDALLVPNDEDGLMLADALIGSDASGTLLLETGHSDRWSGDRPYDSAIISSLGEALGLARGFSDSLPPAYLVNERDDAERLARAFPGTAFISRDRLWAQNGVLHIQGQRAAPGTLGRTRELQEIASQLPDLEGVLHQTIALLDRLVDERTAAAARIHRLDEQIGSLKQESAVAQARRQDTLNRQHRVKTDFQTLETEQSEVLRELERLGARRGQLQSEQEKARESHNQLQTRFDDSQLESELARNEREGLKAAGAGRQGELAVLTERVDTHDTENSRLRTQLSALTVNLTEWATDEAKLKGRTSELDSALRAAERELQEALERRAGAEEFTVEGQQQLDHQREVVRELEQSVENLRKQREGERDTIEALRVRQAARLQDAEHLQQTFRETFQKDLPEEPGEVPDNLEELENDVSQRRATLERMGPVNVLAAHEYAEQEERFAFLTEQRTDVVNSITSLRATIKEINETSTERFMETFEEVNRRFGETFVNLFQGGEALMRLLDESDILESGIEIIARPPGKRPQNINLLSGGEKALTAIALLFALFATKPSPFCILDEVDAPLDDSNVLRYVRTLREMATDTQFLVITHNKLTMEAASSLYGVTMEEKGVSKLVGVDVDQLHPDELLVG